MVTWDGSKTIPIEYVEWLESERSRIEKLDLNEITWTRDGKPVAVSSEKIDDWRFAGLGNILFALDSETEHDDNA